MRVLKSLFLLFFLAFSAASCTENRAFAIEARGLAARGGLAGGPADAGAICGLNFRRRVWVSEWVRARWQDRFADPRALSAMCGGPRLLLCLDRGSLCPVSFSRRGVLRLRPGGQP